MDEYMGIVSNCTDIPKAIGFGISNAKTGRKTLKNYCDGIIIGSAIVKKVDEIEDREEMLENVKAFVKSVKAVL